MTMCPLYLWCLHVSTTREWMCPRFPSNSTHLFSFASSSKESWDKYETREPFLGRKHENEKPEKPTVPTYSRFQKSRGHPCKSQFYGHFIATDRKTVLMSFPNALWTDFCLCPNVQCKERKSNANFYYMYSSNFAYNLQSHSGQHWRFVLVIKRIFTDIIIDTFLVFQSVSLQRIRRRVCSKRWLPGKWWRCSWSNNGWTHLKRPGLILLWAIVHSWHHRHRPDLGFHEAFGHNDSHANGHHNHQKDTDAYYNVLYQTHVCNANTYLLSKKVHWIRTTSYLTLIHIWLVLHIFCLRLSFALDLHHQKMCKN